MPLVLAVHTIQSAPSATVPFAVILLQDACANRKVPAEFKCRQLIPSSGATSTSLWDASDVTALKAWLDETINVDVEHTVYEVQEEFAIGLGEVVRARAAEKVAEGTKEVAQKTGRALGAAASTVGQQAIELDHKLRLSERATAAGTAIKESAVGRSTSAAFGRLGSAMGASTKKVLENDKVNAATEAVGSSFKKLGASLSSLAGGRRNSMNGHGEDGVPTEHAPQFIQEDGGYEPPRTQPTYSAPEPPTGGSVRNHAAAVGAAAPSSALAADEQQLGGGGGGAQFTLDDGETKHP